MRSGRVLLALAAALAALVLLVGCGGSSRRVAPAIQTTSADSLDDALAELDALETPDGVDPALFAQLKDALEKALLYKVGTITGGTGGLRPVG